jgi:RNA polymerase sigma-70 factor (ECF subfamily)
VGGWRDLFEAGRSAWPGIELDPEAFARYLEERAAAAGAKASAPELYLACACLRGVPGAVEAFDRRYLGDLAAPLARIDRATGFADEVRQELRTKLFTGASPKIGDFSGRGSLAGWVRVAAVRTALNLRRPAAAPPPEIAEALPIPGDPELGVLKERYGEAFRAAFRDALADLTSRERALLRLHHLEGLSLGRIAALYRVGTTTVHRWMAAACEAVLAGTMGRMRDRLGLSTAELDSLAGDLRSRLDVSLRWFLSSRA